MSNKTVIADRRLCLTADGEICEESDVRAAYLVAGIGSPIPAEYVDRVVDYLSAGEAEEPEAEPADGDSSDGAAAGADTGAEADDGATTAEPADEPAGAKQAAKPDDKQAKPAANK